MDTVTILCLESYNIILKLSEMRCRQQVQQKCSGNLLPISEKHKGNSEEKYHLSFYKDQALILLKLMILEEIRLQLLKPLIQREAELEFA